jgi:integrase
MNNQQLQSGSVSLIIALKNRCGEALRLKWNDVDLERGIITLNEPEKGSNPRIFNELSGKLLSMLNTLPKENENKVYAVTLTRPCISDPNHGKAWKCGRGEVSRFVLLSTVTFFPLFC